ELCPFLAVHPRLRPLRRFEHRLGEVSLIAGAHPGTNGIRIQVVFTQQPDLGSAFDALIPLTHDVVLERHRERSSPLRTSTDGVVDHCSLRSPHRLPGVSRTAWQPTCSRGEARFGAQGSAEQRVTYGGPRRT